MKIVFTGNTGFPIGLAEVNKLFLMAKALKEWNNEVIVLNKKGMHRKHHDQLSVSGNFHGIDYLYLSKNLYRKKSFLGRRLNEIKGTINELYFYRKNKSDLVFLNSRNFFNILYYWFLSKIFKFKLAHHHVEYSLALPKAQKGFPKFKAKLFEYYAWNFLDFVFPISEYLERSIRKYNSKIPLLRIPPLVNYNFIENIKKSNNSQKYFLFAGSADYFSIIKFIINSFEKTENKNVYLYLIINGNNTKVKDVNNLISISKKRNQIKRFSYLKYDELIKMYKNSLALLIPLSPDIRDIARFPHKIAEYTASGRPIITTNHGEAKNYFMHKSNALLTNSYNIDEFSLMMKFVINNPKEADSIGQKGKELCKKEFDYNAFAIKFHSFLKAQNLYIENN